MATDRRDGTAGDFRDLSVGQPLEVVQDDDGALGERQRGEGVADRAGSEVALTLSVRRATGDAPDE